MGHETVKFVDIVAQYDDITDDILEMIKDAMSKSAFVGGPVLQGFEVEMAEYVGVKHAIGCSNGTIALTLALQAAGMRKGDRVIVPTNSFIASANAVVHAGGEPILVDCDPDSYLIDLNAVEAALKSNTARFILPVHLYGNPCPMDEVLSLADKYGATVIEDNAQAIGGAYRGKKTGSFGTAAGVSFYPAKNLGAFGQGGVVLTDDGAVAERIRILTEQGQGSEKYHHVEIGYNARLHTLQAGILRMMLPRLDSFNEKRSQVASLYRELLPSDRLQTPTPDSRHVYHLFEYRCDDERQRDVLADRLAEADIQFGYHYPVPIHKQQAYRSLNGLSLPVSERLATTLISLPIHPSLTADQVRRVCEVVRSL